ncbi:hypothetical protein Tco_0443120 [Tanacetum coccineum]
MQGSRGLRPLAGSRDNTLAGVPLPGDDGEGDDDEVAVVMRMVAVTMVTAGGGAAGVVMGTKVVRVTSVVDDVVGQNLVSDICKVRQLILDEAKGCPSKVLSIRESHNLRESNSQKGDDGEGDDDEVAVVMRMVAVTMVTARGGSAGVVMGTKVVRVTSVVDDVVG